MPPSSWRRPAVVLFVALLLVGAACSSTTDAASDPDGQPVSGAVSLDDASGDSGGQAPTDDAAGDAGSVGTSELADLITELPAAPTGLPGPRPEQPQPVGLTIDALGIGVASVIGVGVDGNGDMEIPPADKVGWYEFGPAPGDEEGSAVLAAHIAYDGSDGVFVDLTDLDLGSIIEVAYDDGSIVKFVAVAKEQYDKTQLPKESIFARSGQPQLVLITCGGDFNPQVRSYDDNIVVYANPVTDGGA